MRSGTMTFSSVFRSTVIPVVGTLGVLAMAGVTAAHQKESPSELASRIDSLIQQLDDEDVLVGLEAETALVKIGAPAVAKLTAATKEGSPKRRQSAAEVLNDIAWATAGMEFSSQIKHPNLAGAVTLVLSPDGKFVYVPGHIAASINVFGRDVTTGRLTHKQTVQDNAQLAGVVTLYLNSDGKFAVAAACRSKTIALYSRDATTGELTLVTMRQRGAEGELKDLEWPIGAIFSTDDKFIYVIDDRKGTVFVFQIERDKDLRLVEIFEGPNRCFDGARGITAHPDGETLYVSSHRAGTLAVLNRDSKTGKLSVRQILRDEDDGVHGLAGTIHTCVTRDGKFVYTVSGRFEGDDAIGVFQVGKDGKLSVLQEFINNESDLKGFAGGAKGITISPDGRHFYASGAKSGSLACFDRDPVSGKLTYVSTLQGWVTGDNGKAGGTLGANGVEFSSDGKFLYLALEDGGAISVLARAALRQP